MIQRRGCFGSGAIVSRARAVTAAPRAFGALAAGLSIGLLLAGCAANPSAIPASRSVQDKSNPGSQENAEIDAPVRADFDAAMKYLKAGEYEKGTALLNAVTQRAPGHATPYINLAIAYEKIGNLSAAEENLKKALDINPDHPVANTEYGLIYRKTGRFAAARKSYERALARYPGFLPARKNLGILCDIYLRDLECALTQYRIYGAAVPDDKTVQIWIADLEKRLGKQEH
jgi:tetratricopeptide (TPR) repeat protein